jgi:hypothetical protein
MTELATIPNIDPVQIPLDDELTLLIKAAYKGRFVICIINKSGKYVELPEQFAVYDIYNQKYWEISGDEKFHAGSLFNVYEIYYKMQPILENFDHYTMEEYCGFPLTSDKYYPKFYTELIKGNLVKNTNKIHVSSTMNLDIGVSIFGNGIPEFTTITNIDDENNIITVNKNAHESCSNITLTVR